MRPVSRRRGMRPAVVVATVALLAAGGTVPASARTAPPEPSGPGTIAPQLAAELAADGEADFWIRFAPRADLTAASRIEDWNRRGAEVARLLRETARASQAEVRAHLDAVGADYQAFWVTNAIHVRNGSDELAAELAARPEVEALLPTTTYQAPVAPSREEPVAAAAGAVEWNVADVRAPEAWAQYGTRGAGITVANLDTGVQYDHPALVDRYRGNQGDGTFVHDYNWFDAAGVCPDAPCDRNGHGTHTMGTMVGDDGADNRVGVAPDVTWIATNGCCPDDAALIASAQWLLEPTDLTGANPDASRRPHIINNSWGSQHPSNDPFLEDVTAAWAASGIFAVWSNGNNGPACRTSGSPGSLPQNYSVGAYGPDGRIADFSSRGGEDGLVKPDISAPGVAVRSAVPGDRYALGDGTSMAAPHVAAAVALLWSAAPDLVGDVDGTRALLDASAVDTPDPQCGGTPGDNNVYGEGRLDALALLDRAPVAGTGRLEVTVTDAVDGTPVPGATIEVAGPVHRQRTAGEDGTYGLPLPPGTYQVSVSAFGYAPQTTEVSVVAGATVAHPVRLAPRDAVTVRGRVTDGSGQGWPLYAAVGVAGQPHLTVHTRPDTGRYELALPAGGSYTLTVEPLYDGYPPVSHEITVGDHSLTHDVAVPVDGDSCPDLGYAHRFDGYEEDFSTGALPDGWSVVDHTGSGHRGWVFDDPDGRGNLTGGDGGFAVTARSPGVVEDLDSSLVSPVFDLSGHAEPVLMFRQHFRPLQDVARVELSLDGGATWQTVLEQTGLVEGPAQEIVPIPQAAGQSQVRVRFHMVDNRLSTRFWEIDDVFVGTRSCEPQRAGLVFGHVRDRNTHAPLNGATVSTVADPTRRTTTVATPDDPALDDGFYWLVDEGWGSAGVTATADGYEAQTRPGSLGAGRPPSRRDFHLPAGRLTVEPDPLTGSVVAGRTTEVTLVVTNTGTAPAQVELRERDGTHEIPRVPDLLGSAGHAEVIRVEGEFSPEAPGATIPTVPARTGRPGPQGRDGLHGPDGPHGTPGTSASAGAWIDLPNYPTRVMDNALAEIDGKIYSAGGMVDGAPLATAYVYDPVDRSWSRIADLPEPLSAAAGAAIDGKFYVAGGWPPLSQGSRALYIYDPATDTWSRGADAPFIFAAAGRAVLDGKLYVVGGCANNCFLSGVHRYDPATDTWQQLADYPVAASHLACAGIAGQVYCAGGTRAGDVTWNRTYAYDPATDTWTRKADLPIQLWGMAYTASSDRLVVSGGVTGGATDIGSGATVNPKALTNEGFVYDPATDRWSSLPPSSQLTYRAGSTCGLVKVGGTMVLGFAPVDTAEMLPTYGDCAPRDVPWLSVDSGPVTLEPGDKLRVTVRLDATGLPPGTYGAGLWIKEDTPYLAYPVDVTLTVRPGRGGPVPG
ncbi:MAG TPA: S8 family serine peptidase [Natronosporangium sp.]|jgi:subtilisin family serine protease/N-acetylneuraminic acid mutarotase